MSLKVLSLFSGIGAFEQALTNLNLPYELVGFSEISPASIQTYCKLHKVNPSENLGDITQINALELPKPDLIVHGSPCQSFSSCGKQHGGDKGSNTRSSLMWYSVDIIQQLKPKYVIWENVRNVVSKRHKHNLDLYIDELSQVGYTSYYKILNAKEYGLPQNRKRIYVISILGEHSPFSFPEPIPLTRTLKDMLEPSVAPKYYLSERMHNQFYANYEKGIMNCSTYTKSQGGKVYWSSGIAPTLAAGTHGYSTGYIIENEGSSEPYILRKFTPLEYIRLQGFPDKLFDIHKELQHSDTAIYKQLGNSIPVSVLEKIFSSLLSKSIHTL